MLVAAVGSRVRLRFWKNSVVGFEMGEVPLDLERIWDRSVGLVEWLGRGRGELRGEFDVEGMEILISRLI